MSLLQRARRRGAEFLNPVPTAKGVENGMLPIIWKMLRGPEERVPKPALAPFRTEAAACAGPAADLRVTWLGHSTVLLELDGRRILTDPMWAGYASPLPFGFGRRFFPVPLALADLPPLDLIVQSHDHYDHLDPATLRQLARLQPTVPVLCPLRVGRYYAAAGWAPQLIHELDWTDSVQVAGLTVTAVPARHFSGRGITGQNQTLWASYVLQGPQHRVFFGGDTGPFLAGHAEIGAAYGPFDLTMLEVGAYGEGWPDIHLGPENAIQAHQALGGKVLLPIHWGTFNLAFHSWREPVEQVQQLAAAAGIPLLLPTPGLPTEVAPAGFSSCWWER
ncbi:MBL fold metallo-hydrolase [Hymenobacter edaphi]|uniref:MBL fold metallo-hydrolase n=1 Tax=Hymenobacter edaphi TaxID=2211146 RepID=A0A328BLI6_9BACT|nr:MBL fold metallo-hydrolase [Hymenobacter edaphi]RAK66836.1 MBL fold metallo-hydrolase [Hymenobacter edaphi]